LKNGVYTVEVRGKKRAEARFTSASGSSTYERLDMLNIFEEQARVVCVRVPEVSADRRIIPFWYRGSMNVNSLTGNGRL
jgi:hypothetical protein